MSVINILFIADPNSLHDLKWMSFFNSNNQFKAVVLARSPHYYAFRRSQIKNEHREVKLVGRPLKDFSIRRVNDTINEVRYIKYLIKRRHIDIIHILYAEPNALWSCFKSYFRIPIIITTHGTDILKTIPHAFEKKDSLNLVVSALYKLAFKQAAHVTCTSLSQLESVHRYLPNVRAVSVVRTGVDTELLLSDTKSFFCLDDDQPFVLFPRVIRRLYNHELAIQAISLLSSSVKRKYKMVFLGKDGGDLLYQKELESMMDMNPEVTWVFKSSISQLQIFELCKRASAVVMTPLSDGSPVSAMEALLCGTPVILPPLSYDKIFLAAHQLSDWDAQSLSELVTKVLVTKPIVELTDEQQNAMGFLFNMNLMVAIYHICLNGDNK